MFAAGNPPDAGYLEKLEQLGHSLLQEGDSEGKFGPNRIAAGYTYFGQLIAHDLSFDGVPFAECGQCEAEEIPNARTPWLDLDHVYGGGPERSPELYAGEKGAERFRIVNNCDLPRGERYKRTGDQTARLARPDLRNLENVIVLQLHVLFMRLHNAAIDQRLGCGIPEVEQEDGTPFNKAARLVRWQYQWLIRNDFLPKLLDPSVAVRVRTSGPRFQWPRGKFFIPIEFSAAVFRFGHSMVRPKYRLNSAPAFTFRDLADPRWAVEPLSSELRIDWKRFFHRGGFTPAPAFGIDTRITPELGAVTAAHATRVNAEGSTPRSHHGQPFALPVRTLQRGASMRLPSGQALVRQLGLEAKMLTAQQLTGATETAGGDRSGTILAESGLVADTPLFYYILREAEMEPYCGDRLGPVGSQIVGDVIEGAFRHDPDSYWHLADRWKPPAWAFSVGPARPINFMGDLIAALGE